MMKMNVAILIFFCESLVIFTFTGAQGQGFTLEVRRSENAITLTCTDSATGNSPVPAPQFFRGMPLVRVDNQNGFTRMGNVLTFRITRGLEDQYTCGTTSVHSNAEAIIALPTSDSVEEPDPTFAVVGQPRQVELKCAISPGNLLERYFVTWYKADDIIYQTNQDGTVDPDSDLERFSHNSSNLALIINNIELDDASNNYHCVLHVVVNPLNGATDSYNILRNLNIRLVVLAHPEITHPPEPQIVVENDRDVTFSCTATGYPSPKIIWFYRGNAVRLGNDDPRPESIIEDHSTTSTLTFPSVSGMDSGKIRCVARAPITGGIRLNTSEVSTHLSVLGQFTDVAVRITVDSDVIFDVDLPVELEDPVRLYLQYIDVDSGKVDEVQTSALYTNLRNIRHIEFDSDVIFERFQVTIAVESVDGTRGPLRPAGQYDKRVPNTPLRELIGQTPVIAVCSVFLVVIICALILSIFVAKNCFDIQKKRLQSNDTKVCKNITEVEKYDKSNHMQDEDTDFVKGVVKSVAGNPPCKNTRRTNSSHRLPIVCKLLRLQSAPVSGTNQEQRADDRLSSSLDLQAQQPNNAVSDTGTQGNRITNDGASEESLSKGSYAVTTFVAKKLYAGLKHPTHRQKFRTIVTKLMEATKDDDSETVPLISGSSSPQEQNGVVHVAINMDGMVDNTDSASDNSGHVEESKN